MRYSITSSYQYQNWGTDVVIGAKNIGANFFMMPSFGGAVSLDQKLKILTFKNRNKLFTLLTTSMIIHNRYYAWMKDFGRFGGSIRIPINTIF